MNLSFCIFLIKISKIFLHLNLPGVKSSLNYSNQSLENILISAIDKLNISHISQISSEKEDRYNFIYDKTQNFSEEQTNPKDLHSKEFENSIRLLKENNNNQILEFTKKFFESIKEILNETVSQTIKRNITDSCFQNLKKLVYNENNDEDIYYFVQFYLGTTFFNNDLNTFKKCRQNNSDLNSYAKIIKKNFNTSYEYYKNLTYLLLYPDADVEYDRTINLPLSSMNILGVCIVNSCNDTEYKHFLFNFNEISGRLIFDFNSSFISSDEDGYNENFKIFNETNLINLFNKRDDSFLFFLPVFIFVLIILLSCCPCLFYLCYCCFKKYPNRNQRLNIQNNQNPNENDEIIRNEFSNNNEMILGNIEREEEPNLDELGDRADGYDENYEEYDQYSDYNNSYWTNGNINVSEIQLLMKKMFFFNNITEFFKSMNLSNVHESENETALSAIKGVRGFSYILGFLGFVFYNVYSAPFKNYDVDSHEYMIKYFFIGLVSYGLRYSRRIFYAIGGFTLVYKFLYYLDDVIDRRKAKDNNEDNDSKNEKINNITESNIRYYCSEDQSDSDEIEENETEEGMKGYDFSNDPKKYLIFSDFVRFISLQSYKYILFILSILIFKFSYFRIKAQFYNPKPLSYKFKDMFDKINIFNILSAVTLFPFEDMQYFFPSINEIRYFLLYSLIIFIGYKYNRRIDILLTLIFVGCLLFKIIIFFLNSNEMHPALFHNSDNYKNDMFFLGSNFNHSFFIIGIFFGQVNYLIQKRIYTKNQLNFTGKVYLKFSFKLSNYVNKLKGKKNTCKKTFLIIFTSLLSTIFIFSFSIFYLILGYDIKKKDLKDFHENFYLKIFYLIDSEIFMMLFFLNFILVSNPGKNLFFSILSNENWKLITKPYFSMICVTPIILLDFIHHSNYRIRIDVFNIIFYSIIGLSINLIASVLIHIFIEIPLKVIFKFIISKKFKK